MNYDKLLNPITDDEISEAIGTGALAMPHHRRIAQAQLQKVIDRIKQKRDNRLKAASYGGDIDKYTHEYSQYMAYDELLKELEG